MCPFKLYENGCAIGAGLRSRRLRRRGLTLVDLVVTILIIGILAAVAMPRFGNLLGKYRLEGAANRIAADLTWARKYARSTSTSQTVQFGTPNASSYTLDGMPAPDGSGTPYVVDLAASPYGVHLVSVDFNGQMTITFDHYGQPDSGGVITIQSGNRVETVTVEAHSGEVSVP